MRRRTLPGPSDVTSATSVINWLNGRATAFTSATGTTTATAYWSNGDVGMIGKSWDGTIAEGVAATGWPGCARYAARDYVTSESKVTASVFATHGVNDDNVFTINFGRWWAALPSSVQKMIWLSQTGHVDPFDFRRTAFVDELHRWFDHYLMGIDNGVRNDPRAAVERSPDVWVTYPGWPVPGTAPVTWHPTAGSVAGVGVLGTAVAPAGTSASFTDNPGQDDDDWAAGPAGTASDRIIYRTAPLTRDTTVSGTAAVTLTVTPSTSAARVSAVLVDYGTTTMRDYAGDGAGITTLTTQSCFGDSSAGDSACYFDTASDTETVSDDVFARGWADLGHFASLTSQATLTPGKPVTITFDLDTTDHTVPAGHTLALIIGGTDQGFIDGPSGKPRLTVDLASSSVVLPLS
jgi:X-Pro dipeptidyl-peptidase